jgi:hypothetical protein
MAEFMNTGISHLVLSPGVTSSTIPEVEEVMNETPRIHTRGPAVKVGGAHSTAWRLL